MGTGVRLGFQKFAFIAPTLISFAFCVHLVVFVDECGCAVVVGVTVVDVGEDGEQLAVGVELVAVRFHLVRADDHVDFDPLERLLHLQTDQHSVQT